jgi:hypothetical protein
MRFIGWLGLCVLTLQLACCQRASHTPGAATNASAPYRVQQWVLPASAGSGQPSLVATADGRLLMSWIDSVQGRRRALQFAAWDSNGRWQSAPRTIAVGNSLVADSANPPRLVTTADGALWVSWLQGNPATHDALQLSRSADGGFNWSTPVAITSAAGSEELGFVSLWPQTRSSVGAAWLAGATVHPDAAGHFTSTGLSAAVFDATLQRSATANIDARVCDCCDTAVAVTTRGALLVFRDRGASEIRDIATARFDGLHWSAPRAVHDDRWHMPACPVNGPAIAAVDDHAVVAWYSAANDQPSVQLARSDDAGDRFSVPVQVDRGNALLGRVAVATDAQQVWVSWMREDSGKQSLWLARYTPDLSRQLQRVQVASLEGRGRITGFPQLVLQAGNAYIVWTDIADGSTQLRGAMVAR